MTENIPLTVRQELTLVGRRTLAQMVILTKELQICFVLFCFVLFCFVLFCFVLLCFALLCFALFCFVLFCLLLVLFFLSLFCFFKPSCFDRWVSSV